MLAFDRAAAGSRKRWEQRSRSSSEDSACTPPLASASGTRMQTCMCTKAKPFNEALQASLNSRLLETLQLAHNVAHLFGCSFVPLCCPEGHMIAAAEGPCSKWCQRRLESQIWPSSAEPPTFQQASAGFPEGIMVAADVHTALLQPSIQNFRN